MPRLISGYLSAQFINYFIKKIWGNKFQHFRRAIKKYLRKTYFSGRDVCLLAGTGRVQPVCHDIRRARAGGHLGGAGRGRVPHRLLHGPPDVPADQQLHGQQRVHHHLHDGQPIHLNLQADRLPATAHSQKCPSVHLAVILFRDNISHSSLLPK